MGELIPIATVEVLWGRYGCSRSRIGDESVLAPKLESGGTDSNCYCRGALGALWLQQQQDHIRVDAPTEA